MKYKEIKVNLSKEITPAFELFLDELDTLGHYEILFDKTVPRESPAHDAMAIISDYTNMRIYLQETDLEKEIRILVWLHSIAPGDFFAETRNIETGDYMTSYLEYYKPFAAGEKIWIVPIWEKEKKIPYGVNALPLYINPGLAFGTGHHETTRLMIARMEKLIEPGAVILDGGCGSGILAIAAAKLGASAVTAFDIDPNAVDSSKYNWEQNDFGPEISLHLQEGGFDLAAAKNSKFDLAVINITFAVISANINDIAAINTERYLFSGVIEEKKEEILALLKKMVGGELVFMDKLNDWILIEWKK